MDWSKYPNFSKAEFDCQHTGKNKMRPEFMQLLQQARNIFKKPMPITSGYRDPMHPIEKRKARPGEHSYGVAADIRVRGEDAIILMNIFIDLGVRRIGVSQKGNARFIHIGIGDQELGFPKALWSY